MTNENMVNMDALRQGSLGDTVGAESSSQLSDSMCKQLDQILDTVFSSSKEVLGNITSIGIKYGVTLENPDHMLVVFPNELVAFQSWNNQQKKTTWRYSKSNHSLEKNGVMVTKDMEDSFMSFIREGLDAMNKKEVSFSKNITKKELAGVR